MKNKGGSFELEVKSNPFPGLRPFSIDESHLFFGREGQTDEVLIKLAENRFVGIIGLSGSGKSSFVFCGVLPILYGGFFADKGSDWRAVVMRPGASPIQNLAEALITDGDAYRVSSKEEKLVQRTITSTLLRSSSTGLVEAIKQTGESLSKNFLILVDQFEELFRFNKGEEMANAGSHESLTFVNLLTEAVKTTDASIYVAITMRSDFIGDCAQFPTLTKMINDSHYLIPQMTREQKRTAILGPVAVADGDISARLVQQVLNDLGDKSDQLPILQHALMRTWDYWFRHRESNEPMDIHHYEAIGKMSGALSKHADEAFNELNDRQKVICEVVFKALTEKKEDGLGIRRPTRLKELAMLARTDAKEVVKVVEVFRKPGRSFLMPPHGTALNEDSFIDISHESLMRIWDRLKEWVNEESESIQMYLRLADAASMYQVGKAGLWRPPDLQLALKWQEKQKPTLTWGQRYHPAYERTMIFLEYSRKEYETQQKAKEEEQRKKLRRQRLFALVLGTATIICLGFLLFALVQQRNAEFAAQQAKEESLRAEQEAQNAIEAKAQADKQRMAAQRSSEEAKEQSLRAKFQAARADTAAKVAQQQAELAKLEKDRADSSRVAAQQAQIDALKAAKEAQLRQRESDSLRYLSIASTLSGKSLLAEDSTQKALLALQAFLYNKEKKGYARNPDIYASLYWSNLGLGLVPDPIRLHQDQIWGLVSHPEKFEIYSASHDGAIRKLNTQTNDDTELYKSDILFNALALSEDGNYLAAGGDNGNIIHLSLLDGMEKSSTLPEGKEITSMAFHPSGDRFYTGDLAGNIYEVSSKNTPKLLLKKNSKIGSMDVNPQKGDIIYTDDMGRLFHYDGIKDSLVIRKEQMFTRVAYNNQGDLLIAGDITGHMYIWDVKSGRLLLDVPAHEDYIYDISFNRTNKLMATASSDKVVKVWDLNNLNNEPIILDDHMWFVFSISFDAHGEKIYSGMQNGRVKEWRINASDYADIICGNISRNFSQEEWDKFIGSDIPYEKTCVELPFGEGVEKNIDNRNKLGE